MSAASRIPREHFRAWEGWCAITPEGEVLPQTLKPNRRAAIAAWQAIFPRKSWRKSYRQGVRVVRIVVHLHPGSCQKVLAVGVTLHNGNGEEVPIDALADCPRPSGLIPSADDKPNDEGAPGGATGDDARNH